MYKLFGHQWSWNTNTNRPVLDFFGLHHERDAILVAVLLFTECRQQQQETRWLRHGLQITWHRYIQTHTQTHAYIHTQTHTQTHAYTQSVNQWYSLVAHTTVWWREQHQRLEWSRNDSQTQRHTDRHTETKRHTDRQTETGIQFLNAIHLSDIAKYYYNDNSRKLLTLKITPDHPTMLTHTTRSGSLEPW